MDDDEAVMLRAAGGDAAAFELLVRRHAPALWRLARSVVADDHRAEDVVQETFVKAHRALSDFRAESTVVTWLSSICYRTAIDSVRRKQLRLVPIDAAEQVRATPAAAADTELRLVLQDALGELPADEREAFTLVHVLGYSSAEAAAIVGVPASTVRSRAGRARERLALSLTALHTAAEE